MDWVEALNRALDYIEDNILSIFRKICRNG